MRMIKAKIGMSKNTNDNREHNYIRIKLYKYNWTC